MLGVTDSERDKSTRVSPGSSLDARALGYNAMERIRLTSLGVRIWRGGLIYGTIGMSCDPASAATLGGGKTQVH